MASERWLIDVNDACESLCRNCGLDREECERIGFCADYMDIKRLPAVYAVEVVHAHWEDGWGVDHVGAKAYDSIDCSNCEEYFKIESHNREYWKERFKVCPFCGAKMDGDGDENI